MSTIVFDEYHCVECDKKVLEKRKLKTCAYCHVKICSECYRKHNHLCIWCYQNVDFQYVKQKTLLLKLIPIILVLIFLLPIPIPLIYLMINNPIIFLRSIPFIIGVVCIFFIYRFILSRKIISSIPDHPDWKSQKSPLIIEDDAKPNEKIQISQINKDTTKRALEEKSFPMEIKSIEQNTLKIDKQIPTDSGGMNIGSLGAEIALPIEQDVEISEPINKETRPPIDPSGKDSSSISSEIPPPVESTTRLNTIDEISHQDISHKEISESIRLENPETIFNDILIPLSISFTEGLNGCRKLITFQHPYSKKWDQISVDVPVDTKWDRSIIIKGKGLPSYDLTEIGNIVIQIHIH